MTDPRVTKFATDATREILNELKSMTRTMHEFTLYIPSDELSEDQLGLAQTFIAAELDIKTSIQIVRILGQVHHPRTGQVLTRVRVVRRV